MSPIPAANTSAFIDFKGSWDRGDDGLQRVSNVPGSLFTIPFRGSSFAVYGRLGLDGQQAVDNRINITIDNGAPFSVFNVDGPMLNNVTLNSSTIHTAKVEVVSGTFSLGRVAWESGDIYAGNQTIPVGTGSGYTTQGDWQQQQGSPMCTRSPNSNITFAFRGNAIVIQGLASVAPNGIGFSATIDTQPSEQSMTVYPSNNVIVDLYRNDTLGEGNHSVTLTTQAADMGGSQFCVSQAIIYNVTAPLPPNGPNGTPSTGASSASPTSTSPLDPIKPKPLSGGQIGGDRRGRASRTVAHPGSFILPLASPSKALLT